MESNVLKNYNYTVYPLTPISRFVVYVPISGGQELLNNPNEVFDWYYQQQGEAAQGNKQQTPQEEQSDEPSSNFDNGTVVNLNFVVKDANDANIDIPGLSITYLGNKLPGSNSYAGNVRFLIVRMKDQADNTRFVPATYNNKSLMIYPQEASLGLELCGLSLAKAIGKKEFANSGQPLVNTGIITEVFGVELSQEFMDLARGGGMAIKWDTLAISPTNYVHTYSMSNTTGSVGINVDIPRHFVAEDEAFVIMTFPDDDADTYGSCVVRKAGNRYFLVDNGSGSYLASKDTSTLIQKIADAGGVSNFNVTTHEVDDDVVNDSRTYFNVISDQN